MKDKRKSIVYKVVNRANGKRYIGVTIKGLPQRISDHFSRARSSRRQTRFSNAIRKHGEDKFEFSLASEWDTYAEALTEEVRLIAIERPEYNITMGGEGILIADRRSHNADWYKKVSAALKGRKRGPLVGEALARAQRLAKNRAKRNVVCLNDGTVGTAQELADKYGVLRNTIFAVCLGREMSAHGYFFARTSLPLSAEEREDEIRRRKNIKNNLRGRLGASRKKAVKCLTTGAVYESGRLAAKELGISPTRVNQLCAKGGQTLDGISMCYLEAA